MSRDKSTKRRGARLVKSHSERAPLMPKPQTASSTTELPPTPTLIAHQLCLVMSPRVDAPGGATALAEATGELLGRMARGGDGIEEMVLTQMLALHNAVMDDLAHGTAHGEFAAKLAHRNSANKSARTFATLLDKLLTIRGRSSEQKVTVEHVHVHSGGKAIVGNVGAGGTTSP